MITTRLEFIQGSSLEPPPYTFFATLLISSGIGPKCSFLLGLRAICNISNDVPAWASDRV